MKTQHNRVFCAALLAVILLLTAAGCAAEKPADRASGEVSAGTSVGPVRLSGSGLLTQPSKDPEADGAETPDTGEDETPGTGEDETPGIGEADMPGIGEGEVPGIGEGEVPGTGEGEVPGTGEVEAPGTGEEETPGTGEGEVPGTGEGEVPGAGEGETPGTGEGETPGTGEGEVPGTGEDETPGTGEEETPGTGESGGISPVILAVCIAAAAIVIAVVIAVAVVVSEKNESSRKQRNVPAEGIAKTENIRREPERRDMSNQQNNQQAPAAPRQGAQADAQRPSGTVQIGKLHNIGRRSAQQDSMGSMSLTGGGDVFAVVADGMGGLSGGDQVSQSVVMSMLQQAGSLGPGQMDGVLSAMVRGANEEVNRQLGPDGIYRSGSTVVAVLVRGGAFHWISVGDSRIYLYRGGSMLQLNQEHTYEVELMQRVMNGEITAAEAAGDPQRRGLTSFIGMGRLKYVDASMRPVVLQSGDRILLMTDGVFNNLPETAMADTLRRNPDVQQAAKILEEQVLALQDPAQDNFTAIILGFQG